MVAVPASAEPEPAPSPARGPNRWRGVDMAGRQAARRRALVDAGLDLVGTIGWAGTTVRKVCAVAGLNPRYFYESFADLDELLLAVYDDVVAQAVGMLAEVAAEAEPELSALIRATVRGGFRLLAEDPRRARVLFVEGAGHAVLDRRRFDTLLAMADLVQRMAARLQPASGKAEPHPRGARLGRVAANLLVGGVTELCVAWVEGRLDMTLDELADDVTDLAIGTAEAAARLAAGASGPP